MINSEINKYCTDHKCSECGKELYEKRSKLEIAFMILFPLFMGGIMLLINYQANTLDKKPWCKIETPMEGGLIISQSVECPQ